MAKKYVVGEAALNCQYGGQDWLVVPENRHIEIGGKLMANKTDYKKNCLKQGGFGFCSSPHINKDIAQSLHDALLENGKTNLYQAVVLPWDEWGQEEKDLLILQRTLSSYAGDEIADVFIRKVSESAGRERKSWKE